MFENALNRKFLLGIMISVISLLIFAVGCENAGNSGSASFDSQIATIQAGNDALNNLDWNAYAAMVHPESLERFRGTIIPGIQKLVLQSPSDSVNLFGKNFSADQIQNEAPDAFFVDIMNMATEVSPDLKSTFETIANDNLGAISESDSLIHVVARTKISVGGQEYDELNVYSLKKFEGEWKMVMSPKIEGIAFMIKNGLPQ